MAEEITTPQLPLAHAIFPGRSVLSIAEVAKALRCTDQHIKDLIDDGLLTGVDIASPGTPRHCLRIPVSSYDNFIRTRIV